MFLELELSDVLARQRVHARVDGSGAWPVVMVHGFGDNLQSWKGLTEALQPAGARALCFDLPGFGGTPLTAEFAADYLRNGARLVLAACRAHGGGFPVTAIGNSLGASLVLFAAALEEEAGGARTVGASLLLSPATPSTRTPPFVRLLRVPTYRWMERLGRKSPRRPWRRSMHMLVRLVIRAMLAPGARPPREWVESVADSLCRERSWTDLEHVAHALRRVLEGGAPEIAAIFARRTISSRPALIVRGVHDRVVGARELDGLALHLPQSRRVELAGVGHCPQVEAPAIVARLAVEARDVAG